MHERPDSEEPENSDSEENHSQENQKIPKHRVLVSFRSFAEGEYSDEYKKQKEHTPKETREQRWGQSVIMVPPQTKEIRRVTQEKESEKYGNKEDEYDDASEDDTRHLKIYPRNGAYMVFLDPGKDAVFCG